MKTKLLFIALMLISVAGYSQTFDNIPTGTGYYINKLIVSPNGDDLTNEYIEIRGTPNTVVPSDLYLISIEGDGNSSSRGKVSEAIQLGDGTRTFGSSGILAITCKYTSTADASVTPSPYLSVISSNATVIEISLEGPDVTSSSSSAVTSKSPDIGYDGNFIDATGTYMLVSASSTPKGVRIDGTSDASDADGVIEATGDHTSWTLYDSVAYMDDNDEGSGEYAYGQIIFAQQNATNSANQYTTTSATVIDFDSSSDVNYILRQYTNTGYTSSDWVAAANGSGSTAPNWVFSSTSGKVSSEGFSGFVMPNSIYGELNPVDNAGTLSAAIFDLDAFSIYPNPANDVVQIVSSLEINKVEMYNVLGKKVTAYFNQHNNNVDISSLSKGIYVLKITSGQSTITKKIIKE